MLDKNKLAAAAIDWETALSRFAGKEELYEKYLMRFIREDTHVAAAKEGLEAKDYQKVLSEIHALKGVVGTLGMNGLFEASSAVVKSVRAEEYDKVPEQMNQVEREYKAVLSVLA